ncbi:anoctamin-4-like isoform X2 [Tachypleus tridentatus]|uniref:anoctamin-4-like isoform X2 n=1 Tax=Tachypleus tridentatus TaxID=6853 RepID=UPI003FD64A9D
MLIPASAVGVLCFIYGFFTLVGDAHSKDVCENHNDVILCPRCDIKGCKYEQLGQTCTFVKITHLFDNGAAVFFAVFMSLWAVIFMELWKRYSAKITHHWDATNFDTLEEHPRPEYLAKLSTVKKKKVNFITGVNEPCVSFWKRRVPCTIFSWSVVLLLIYRRIATFLTELEIHRTQSDYENSLTLKMYMLKFVNYYSSVFYIAFFKGRFVGYPGHYNSLFGYRQEEVCITLSVFLFYKSSDVKLLFKFSFCTQFIHSTV